MALNLELEHESYLLNLIPHLKLRSLDVTPECRAEPVDSGS